MGKAGERPRGAGFFCAPCRADGGETPDGGRRRRRQGRAARALSAASDRLQGRDGKGGKGGRDRARMDVDKQPADRPEGTEGQEGGGRVSRKGQQAEAARTSRAREPAATPMGAEGDFSPPTGERRQARGAKPPQSRLARKDGPMAAEHERGSTQTHHRRGEAPPSHPAAPSARDEPRPGTSRPEGVLLRSSASMARRGQGAPVTNTQAEDGDRRPTTATGNRGVCELSRAGGPWA